MSKRSAELDDFRVPFYGEKGSAKFSLDAYDPSAKPFSGASKAADRERIEQIASGLDQLQECLHTQPEKRVLLILQGMDTSGKDGTVRTLFRDVTPLGLRIASFKAPTPLERSHDYLWRVHAQVPAAGELVVFNRSQYEDVLVPRVLGQIDARECERRYRQIRDFESYLHATGTTILKCFLDISKDEQRRRLQERVDDPAKHWKFDLADIEARKYWGAYQEAYRDALAATSVPHAPWYVIPADSKTQRDLMVAELLLRTLTDMKLSFPPPKPELIGYVVE